MTKEGIWCCSQHGYFQEEAGIVDKAAILVVLPGLVEDAQRKIPRKLTTLPTTRATVLVVGAGLCTRSIAELLSRRSLQWTALITRPLSFGREGCAHGTWIRVVVGTPFGTNTVPLCRGSTD